MWLQNGLLGSACVQSESNVHDLGVCEVCESKQAMETTSSLNAIQLLAFTEPMK